MNRSFKYYGFRLQYIQHKISKFFRKSTSISLSIIIIIWIVIIWFSYSIYNKLYSADYRIDSIGYTIESINTYNDPLLYNTISLWYICRYYSDVKLLWDEKTYDKKIQEEFPFIESISIVSFSKNKLILDVKFHKPLLRFMYKNDIYWAYKNNLIILWTKDTLGYGIPLILLPQYLQWSSSDISWLLYNINLDKMLYDLLLLKSSSLSWSITYIPWGDKYILRNKDIRVYFNAKKDINHQLMILSTLMTEYRWFKDIKQIDVGSLDNPIVK
jgi:hypothetical protein